MQKEEDNATERPGKAEIESEVPIPETVDANNNDVALSSGQKRSEAEPITESI